MSDHDIDPRLLILRRQYMQLFEPDFLAWPPSSLLKSADVQKWLYKRLFDPSLNPKLPPEGYQMRVLKLLLSKIKKATDEHEVSCELKTHLASLAARGAPPEFQTFHEKAYVTFTCTPEKPDLVDGYDDAPERTVTLLERRHLVSGSRTTGFRTWEASLHLASYLLTDTGSSFVRNKNVLELGTGTGFLTILLAKHLQAKRVTATDGDEDVIEALNENIALNKLDNPQRARTGTLTWGCDLEGTWVEDDCGTHPYDIVIGTDITYDKIAISALVSTLYSLFNMRPELKVIISSVVRNAETFEVFKDECASRNFAVEDVEFEPKPMRQQKSLFYAAAVPIKILSITRP
ncbi:putative methyltransferase-domain-containing protein [Annulohypoxylon truncatum]|uniref:putative methyltransferase-domain-containing protein n=1 Tax=Annulohypoxylon truncatum TaxID=327061 RepID=UPI002007F872|nr:putative methyltransferase-domain-containing protein [Annulohypoxylon truncatum]KAI1204552.1 putative methyltransferase-domain-containing protein [Annulohypoxylon truncatum]